MQLHLVDEDPSLVAAWCEAFRTFREVTIRQANILSVAQNTVVAPASSQGFMEGGIDRAYLDFFGVHFQTRVQEAIARRPEALPAGASLVVHTAHPRILYLVVVPTMVLPEPVTADNSYRAMRAVLRLAGQDAEVGRKVFCPGLAMGVGLVTPFMVAREMARAYADWKRES